ncbi:Bug family tripartite tricarboxylate transporter substrate binding protein, partial [Falsiroseomonas oryzae]|uniref:Bug family tripartite tricarboxylate transporter substrate binding protein n=1 Tax=Falsiroseomonas oryzae TaxID=2766473 RepID=UPI0022EA167F
GAVAAARSARAQPRTWQLTRPLRLVVPSVPGSTPDLVCRLLAEALRPALPQPVIVENRPGGWGTIGLLEVVRAAPDGHTLGYANVVTLAINATLLPSQPYVAERDLAPVALMGFVPNALVVRPGLPVDDVAGLVALLRAAPGRLTYGSPGNATTGHLSGELFRTMTGTEMLHVPYRGSPQAMQALAAGEVDLVFDNISSVEQAVGQGLARPLAVAGARRSPRFPEVPTLQEAGLAGYEATAWGGLVAAAATPSDAIAALHDAVATALASTALRA